MTRDVSPRQRRQERFSSTEKLMNQVRARGRDTSSRVFQAVYGLYQQQNGALTGKTLDVVDTILFELASEVETMLRASVARQLSGQTNVPERLMGFLADDDLQVAQYPLKQCAALTDRQLVRIAEQKSQQHRLLIAGRETVSLTVSRTLAAKKEMPVLTALSRNLGAALDDDIIQLLLEASRTNQSLCEALLCRPELGAEHAHAMFWWVSSGLRTYILENYDIGVEVIDRALRAATHDAPVEKGQSPFALARPQSRFVDAEKLDQFTGLFRILEGDDLSRKLAEIMGIRENTAHRILNDSSGEALAVCCKALNAGRQQFVRIFLVIDYSWFHEVRPTGHIERITRVYDAMTSEQARRTLDYWDLQDEAAA